MATSISPRPSEGHLVFVGDYEWFFGADGVGLYRAPVAAPFGPDGQRTSAELALAGGSIGVRAALHYAAENTPRAGRA